MDQQTTDAIASGAIIQCKPWGKDQGSFVLVNASDFDPSRHTRFDADPLNHDGNGKRGGSKPRKPKEG